MGMGYLLFFLVVAGFQYNDWFVLCKGMCSVYELVGFFYCFYVYQDIGSVVVCFEKVDQVCKVDVCYSVYGYEVVEVYILFYCLVECRYIKCVVLRNECNVVWVSYVGRKIGIEFQIRIDEVYVIGFKYVYIMFLCNFFNVF